MISRSLKYVVGVFLAVLFFMPAAGAQDKGKADISKIPKKVMDSLKARFPNPEIQIWTQEKEGGIVFYDIEFTQAGKKLEADIREDGTILNWEKAIPVADLPAAVRKTVDAKYPKATIKEAMAVTEVKAGKDVLEGYEITLDTAAGKSVEITVAPDGKVLEEPGEQK